MARSLPPPSLLMAQPLEKYLFLRLPQQTEDISKKIFKYDLNLTLTSCQEFLPLDFKDSVLFPKFGHVP